MYWLGFPGFVSLSQPGSGEICDSPCEHDKDSDQWEIDITVRHGLVTHLHDSDHRDEVSEEPEPSDEQIRARAAPGPDQRRNRP